MFLVLAALSCNHRPEADSPGALAPSVALVPQLGHRGTLNTVEFSADGARALTAGLDGSAILWDVESGAILHKLALGGWGDAAWSGDGRLVLTVADGVAALWDTRTGARRVGIEGPEVDRVGALSPDGSRVWTHAAVWDARSGARLRALDLGHEEVRRLEFSADGERVLVVPWWSGPASLHDARTGRRIAALKGLPTDVAEARHTPDGSAVAGLDTDGHVALWDRRGALRWTAALGAHGDHEWLVFSADGSRLAAPSDDGVAVLRVSDGATVHVVDAALSAAALSPDGRQLVGLLDGAVARWDLATGQRLAGADPGYATALALSPDGERILTGGPDGQAWSWTLAEAAPRALTSSGAPLLEARLTPDGTRLLTLTDSGEVVVWDTARGHVISRASYPLELNGLRAASDAAPLVALADPDHQVTLLDWATGKVITRHGGPAAPAPTALAFSPDGQQLAIGDASGSIAVRRAADGALTWQTQLGSAISALAFGDDGWRLAYGTEEHGGGSLEARSGATAGPGSGAMWVCAAAGAGDGRMAFGSPKEVVIVWRSGSTIHREAGGPYPRGVDQVAFSPDGSRLAVAWMAEGAPYGHVHLWDPGSDTLPVDLPHRSAVDRLVFSADGTRLLTESWTDVYLWDVATGTLLATGAHDDFVESVTFVDGDRRILSASRDGTARLWDGHTGAEVAALMPLEEGWAVVDPAGRFDASDDGQVAGLRWTIDGASYGLHQLRAAFYDPGLLAKVLGRVSAPLRDVPALGAIAPPARAHFDGLTPDGRVTLAVEDRGGGIGELLVRLNGSDVSAWVGEQCPQLRAAACAVDLAGLPTWVPGRTNTLVAEVGNAADTVSSRGLDVSVQAAGEPAGEPPELWVLAIGTSDYSGEALDLEYAARDAERLGRALGLAGARGFGAVATHVRVLSTEPGDPRPARRAVEEGFAWLAGSGPQDTVVVFLSGHGVAVSDAAAGIDDYFYLLPDAASFEDVRDPALRDLRSWSGQALADALARVPALKRVVVLDTCAAGKAEQNLFASRAVSSDALRAHARSRERTGAWLLAGAAADQVSYEASRYGQGVLTWTLLDGMRGPALDGAGALFVSRWFQHAEDQVLANAAGVGGIQVPVLRRGAGDFPLGELAPQDRGQIPVQPTRAVVVRSLVTGLAGRQDPSGLGASLDARLRELAAADGARFVQWDSEPARGTWQVTGQVRAGSPLAFEGFATLQGDGGREVPLAASGADAAQLAASLAGQVARAVVAR